MADEEEELEEYKQQANALKDKGNAAFQANDIQEAIRFFSQALDIDPDNYIVFSNRSAAYMKADSKSKALKDAERCVELAPNWAKGYSRLGAAQQSLRRYDAAIDTYKKGIELDPNNKALWTALRTCQDAFGADKKQRFEQAAREREIEEARLKRMDEIKKEMAQDKKEVNQEDDLLSSFFGEVVGGTEKKAEQAESKQSGEDDELASFFSEVIQPNKATTGEVKSTVVASAEDSKDGEEEEKILSEKYTKQNLGDGKSQFDRLLASHHEWRNLNPYYVLQLDNDATVEDIKLRYKKLSLKVHPDRNPEVENARQAFEYVKEAYLKLMDDDQRRVTSLHIDNVTVELKRDRKKLLSKGLTESELPEYEEERNKRLMKHFADMEHMKRKSEQNRRSYSAREKKMEEDEEEKWSRFQEFDKDWSEENRREKRVGNWRDFGPTAKKAKAANFKEEVREDTLHGTAKLETWKKAWK